MLPMVIFRYSETVDLLERGSQPGASFFMSWGLLKMLINKLIYLDLYI